MMNADSPLYLSSLESHRFEPVRECRFIRFLRFTSDKPCVLATLSPGVPGQEFNAPGDLETFVLATRHEGASLDPIDTFPCFVFISIPKADLPDDVDVISTDDVEIIGWGELYRTAEDAASHKFD